MIAIDYILTRQTLWAQRHGIKLTGSRGERGKPCYTSDLDSNLFESLSAQTRADFEHGDGGEIYGSPAKMQAVHSSSALGVNVFQYWQKTGLVSTIAAACGFCKPGEVFCEKIIFEDPYIIDEDAGAFPRPANIDVVFHNSESAPFKRFAVECKFSEAYGGRKHGGLRPVYLETAHLWSDIPHLYAYAKTICPDEFFIHLHSAQLIKHILGLKRKCGKDGFKLLYLWYDVAGREGAVHRDEIDQFASVVNSDGIRFNAVSYQELILALSRDHKIDHQAYIQYLAERYL